MFTLLMLVSLSLFLAGAIVFFIGAFADIKWMEKAAALVLWFTLALILAGTLTMVWYGILVLMLG